MSQGTSGGNVMINAHDWNTPIKEEPSITPPPMAIADSSSLFSQNIKSEMLPKDDEGSTDRRKNQKKQKGELSKAPDLQLIQVNIGEWLPIISCAWLAL